MNGNQRIWDQVYSEYGASSNIRYILILWLAALLMSGCRLEEPNIIIITATPDGTLSANNVEAPSIQQRNNISSLQLSPSPASPLSVPTPNSTRQPVEIPDEHVVQAGDTLSAIAQRYAISMDELQTLNNIENPNLLSVGQVLALPDTTTTFSPSFKIIPDGRLVRAPGSESFDVASFIAKQPGYIRRATDEVGFRQANGAEVKRELNATAIVTQVSLEYSVDPRLLLILLEYEADWLSKSNIDISSQTHPLISEEASGSIDRSGLYKQLAWAANELNRGYYGWKYRGLNRVLLPDGTRSSFALGLNAGTVAIQYYFSLSAATYTTWQQNIGVDGLYSLYATYFGDPFTNVPDPIVPETLTQPTLTLPFSENEEWRFTGGYHGGWGAGSAWAALDFAPPDERPIETMFCYTSTSWVTAIADGVIVRSGDGSVVLDLDGDGVESTGWTIVYLHIAEEDRIAPGRQVSVGDRLGHPSCEGGFSNATHLHIARRYNGEWIPADCQACSDDLSPPAFVMSDWEVIGIRDQQYQGFLQRGDLTVQAEQGTQTTVNLISR